MKTVKQQQTARVKIMNSYDYSHFEVEISKEVSSIEDIDNIRKDAQRLVDKAIVQYKIAKKVASIMPDSELERKANAILENFPKSTWTPEQAALVKRKEQIDYLTTHGYDYEDDIEYPF